MLELASWRGGPTHLSVCFFWDDFFSSSFLKVVLIIIQLSLRFLAILLYDVRVLVDCVGVSKLARWSNSSIRLPGDQGSEMVALITHNTPWQRFVFVLYWQRLSRLHILLPLSWSITVSEINQDWEKRFISLIKDGNSKQNRGVLNNFVNKKNSLLKLLLGDLWSKYWRVDYHRWALTGPLGGRDRGVAQRWPLSSSPGLATLAEHPPGCGLAWS